MQTGTRVQNTVVIQSDDREIGIDDGSPLVPIGTSGNVLGLSKDNLEPDCHLKDGAEDCLLVQFELSDGNHYNFDVHPSELVII